MLPSRSNDRDHINEQGASVVSFTHEQNSICSQKQLNDIAPEHTIICRQLFADHVVGSRLMKRKRHLHRMIIEYVCKQALNQALLSLPWPVLFLLPFARQADKASLEKRTGFVSVECRQHFLSKLSDDFCGQSLFNC